MQNLEDLYLYAPLAYAPAFAGMAFVLGSEALRHWCRRSVIVDVLVSHCSWVWS